MQSVAMWRLDATGGEEDEKERGRGEGGRER